MRHAIVLLMLLAAPGSVQAAPPADGPITCTAPVSVEDSAKSLLQRYGDQAVLDDKLYTGVEDITYQGVVLSPKSPELRIEIGFTDETMRRVSRLTLIDSTTSHWNVAGVTLGSTLAEVQKINGRPFLIREFFTDGGGFVVDWKGGALGRPLPGGCFLEVRFGKGRDDRAPAADRVSSDKAEVRKWGPVVEQIVVIFPEK
ncbi:hypothetical protein S58_33850 [Bradyrhizobium oligotrophicum S58]|uniref:Uncharacterized protein n=1 Tax=Bradyrhizobium oligotrophicum S58 TaxID=1245469 RepID=M4Z893_9BRAD|nr:hypothetical protein [Bradyrhizobium oligotrophicum]BAM89381.1 hypothetical protein S58_33850 [Bradyrhizobium oligotrophicum S58]